MLRTLRKQCMITKRKQQQKQITEFFGAGLVELCELQFNPFKMNAPFNEYRCASNADFTSTKLGLINFCFTLNIYLIPMDLFPFERRNSIKIFLSPVFIKQEQLNYYDYTRYKYTVPYWNVV